jgi:hypothetical protein
LRALLRAFLDFVVGTSRFPPPAALQAAFDAWQPPHAPAGVVDGDSDSAASADYDCCDDDDDDALRLRRSFADAFVKVAHGGSLRRVPAASVLLLCRSMSHRSIDDA